MMRGIRVLALVTDAFGGYGGIARYNQDLLTALGAMGADVLALPRVGDAPAGALPTGVVQRGAVHNKALYAGQAVWAALTFRPHMVLNAHLYHGPLSQRVARLAGARLVSQLHGTEIWDGIAPPHAAALMRSDLVLSVSQDTRRRLLGTLPCMTERAAVVPNTVGPEFSPADRSAARARFGLADEAAIVTVARLDTRGGYKGHERIIGLLRTLQRPQRPVVYLVAGVGGDRQRLEKLAQDQDVADRVRFLGRVPQQDLPDLYRAADLFALASSGEGFGIVYLEATACGTPAIGLNVGGTADALMDGALGTLCAPEDFETALPIALEDALQMTLEERRDLSERTVSAFGKSAFQSAVAGALEPLTRPR